MMQAGEAMQTRGRVALRCRLVGLSCWSERYGQPVSRRCAAAPMGCVVMLVSLLWPLA